VFEAIHTERIAVDAAAIWSLWADPSRWADWNEQIESAEVEGELRVGAEARVKFKRGGTVKFNVIELEQQHLFVDEAKFPGARLGHEHRMKPGRSSVEVTHRLYVEGPMSGFWSLMLSRKSMRELVVSFTRREREPTEPNAAPPKTRGKGRRG